MAKTVKIGPYSAYAIAVAAGYHGTEQEWLASLVGPQGAQGASITGAVIDADGHLILTVHDPKTSTDTTIDAGSIDTTGAVQSVLQQIQQAGADAVASISNSVQQAADSADEAKTSAGEAKDSATQAEASKASAAGSATQAGQSATEAANSAGEAAGSAGEAAKSAEEAKKAAENSGLPQPSGASNAGKVPVVKDDGTYELGESAEVVDIRTGNDGRVYNTAGDAVRGQTKELSDENTALINNLGEIITFPEVKSPFKEEYFSYSGSNGIAPDFYAGGFSFTTSGFNDGNMFFTVPGLTIGHRYRLEFDVSKDAVHKIIVGSHEIDNAVGHQEHEFEADSGSLWMNFQILYTETNFEITNAKLVDLDDKTVLLEESRAKKAESKLQEQILGRITKSELKDVITFPEPTNPLVTDNYKYTGSNNINLSFSDNGFVISNPDGANDVNMWFDIPGLIIGHEYSLSFDVTSGELYIVRISDFTQNNVNGEFEHKFTATKETQSVNIGIWYTNATVSVENVKFTDLDEKTRLANAYWYKGKKGARFGDSITAQADFWESGDLEGSGWSVLVKEYFGCSDIVNCGIGGSTVSGDLVTNAMWTGERINALPSDSDFVLFMGGTNDWMQNKELGDADSSDTSTFNGALNVIAQKLSTKYQTGLIIWMCNVYGKKNVEDEKNSVGLTLYDYSRAFIESANRNGFPVIDMYKSWTKYNYAIYLNAEDEGRSFIHPNRKGGVKMANIIVSGMKACEPVIE